MYAIIETGGKQYKVQSGDVLFIEKLDASEETAVTFDKVIALHNDKDLKLGAPYIKGASVDARVLKQGKGKKITVFTYRPKKGSSRKMGHRQPYTKVQIEQIRARAPGLRKQRRRPRLKPRHDPGAVFHAGRGPVRFLHPGPRGTGRGGTGYPLRCGLIGRHFGREHLD